MKIYFKILLIILGVVTSACKKKTDMMVQVYNYALREPVKHALVVLVEKKGEAGSGIFSGNAECKVIETLRADENGYVNISEKKLKSAGKINYFFAVAEAYGVGQRYSCGAKSGEYIKKGEEQLQVLDNSNHEGFFILRVHNLFDVSDRGDSLLLAVQSPQYSVPGKSVPFGGGGISYHSAVNLGLPSPVLQETQKQKCQAGYAVLRINKKKLGVKYYLTDTIKVLPYQTVIHDVYW